MKWITLLFQVVRITNSLCLFVVGQPFDLFFGLCNVKIGYNSIHMQVHLSLISPHI